MTDAHGSRVRTDGGVAVLETDPTGHRLHYLAHLVEALGAGRCTVLTSEQAVRSDEYRLLAASMTGPTVVLPESGSPRAVLTAAVSAARASGVCRLVVPEGDWYLLPVLLLMLRHPRLRLEIRLLLMRTTTIDGPERLRPATVVKPVLAQLLRMFRQVRVLFLTDALGVVTRRRGYAGLQAVKDPVLRTGAATHDRPRWFPPAVGGSILVGVFGVVSARKNLPVLVEAMSGVPEAFLVVGGRLEPDVRAFVDSDERAAALLASGRMVVVDRLLDPEELAAGLASVDVVAVLHDNDSPSGILAEACVRGTPVLVPRGGWLAEVVDTSGVGMSTPLTSTGVADGIRRVIEDQDAHVEAIRRQSPRIDTSDFTDRLLGI